MLTIPEDSDNNDISQINDGQEAKYPRSDAKQSNDRLADEDLQAHYEQEYRKQLRLRQCPGCGEDELF